MNIGDFKKGYQSIINIIKDGKGDLVPDSKIIFPRWRNHLSQLFNVHGVEVVKHTEIHTPGPVVPEHSAFEVETNIEELIHKSLGTYQFPAELVKAGGAF
jgi:hypothetical protein